MNEFAIDTQRKNRRSRKSNPNDKKTKKENFPMKFDETDDSSWNNFGRNEDKRMPKDSYARPTNTPTKAHSQ